MGMNHDLRYSLPDEIYKGNSARHWHTKAIAYGDHLLDCWDIIRKSNIHIESTSLKDAIREIIAKLEDQPDGEVRLMGIYYYAVDEKQKKQIWPPDDFASKLPSVYHPKNPFPGMVMMMNLKGYNYKLHDDFHSFHDKDEYEDITDEVYKEYKETFKSFYDDEIKGILNE